MKIKRIIRLAEKQIQRGCTRNCRKIGKRYSNNHDNPKHCPRDKKQSVSLNQKPGMLKPPSQKSEDHSYLINNHFRTSFISFLTMSVKHLSFKTYTDSFRWRIACETRLTFSFISINAA